MADVTTRDEITIFDPDVSNLLSLRIKANPVLGLFRIGQQRRANEDMSFQTQEQVRAEKFGTLTGDYTASDSDLTVADSSVFVNQDQVHIEDHQDVNFRDLDFVVTNIPDATHIDITLIRGADTSIAFATSSVIKIVRGHPDNALAGTGKYTEPDLVKFYIQLFQQDIEFGQNALDLSNAGGLYGRNVKADGFDQKLQDMAWDIWEAVMHGTGRAGSSTSVPAITKSLSEMVNSATQQNVVGCGGGSLTETFMNEMVKKILLSGGRRGPKVLLSNLDNVQTLSNLRHDKVQYVTEGVRNDFGGRVEIFTSNFAQIGTITLIGDENYEKHTALLLDLNDIELVPINGRLGGAGIRGIIENSSTPGQFGESWVMRSQLGLQLMHQDIDHGVFNDLAL